MIRSLITVLAVLAAVGTNAQLPWYQKSDFGGEARHRATAFAVGNKGYMGLGHINSVVDIEYDDIWEYDPSADTWTQKANYPEGKVFHAACFVIGNIAYVGSGRLENGTYSKKFFAFDPQLNSWSPIPDLPGAARRGAVGISINGRGYIGTGQTTMGYSNDFYEYNPTTNSWLAKASFPGAPRTSAVGFSIGAYGYLGTGNTNSGSINDFYRYDPVTNQWLMRANVGPTTRQEAVGFAVNGLGYIGTGDDYSSGNNYSDMWEYDPATNIWIQAEDFSGTARRYLVAFVIDDRAYAGTGTNGTNFRDFWVFDRSLSTLEHYLNKMDLVLFPNPVQDEMFVDLGSVPEGVTLSEIELKVHSITGSQVYSCHYLNEKFQLNTSNLKQGTYILSLHYHDRIVKTAHFIKQ